MNCLKFVAVTETLTQNRKDKDIYHGHSTKLIIKDIQELDNGNLLITTSRVFENFSILGDLWVEIIFQFEYDIHHEAAQKLLANLGYSEFQNISVFDFMRIKTKGRKLYKYTASKARKIKCTSRRKLDMTNFDDVDTIWKLYYAKVSEYKNMVDDIKYFTSFVELDKDKYEGDLRDMNKYREIRDRLLEDASDSEDSSSS